MDYAEWIQREKRIRSHILVNHFEQGNRDFYICQACLEVCLCHENPCANCGSTDVERHVLEFGTSAELLRFLESLIRCRRRYEQIALNSESD